MPTFFKQKPKKLDIFYLKNKKLVGFKIPVQKIRNSFFFIYQQNRCVTFQLYFFESPKMLIDTFEYPPDRKRIAIHQDANRIGKMRYRTYVNSMQDFNNQNITYSNVGQCYDCGRYVTACPPFKCHESQEQLEQRFGIYGPNCVIYLGFIKRIAIFLLICTIIFALPMFVINLHGYACQIKNFCVSTDAIHSWSVYNVFGLDPGTLPHSILWLIFCFFMIAFTVYLRKYAIQTYRRISDKNVTDSDYCLLLRRLPELVSEKQIREVIEKQITRINEDPNRTQKIRNYSIRDIIMIKKHDDAIKSLKKQVHYFKKTAKRNKGSNFVPAPIPKPVEFAEAAIVRFQNMTASKQIARSIQSPFIERLLNFFCVSYNPKTQHMINQKHISVSNAPHPTDMLWHNFGFSERSRIIRKTLLTLGAVGVLILSGIVALIFSYWMEIVTNTQGQRPVVLTIIIVLIVLIFNRIIRKIVVYTTKMERLQTKTDKKSEQINLTVIHESLNLGFFSIIVPILVQLPEYIANQTTKSSSFPLIMLTTIIIQAIVTNILDFIVHYFDIKQKIFIWLDNKKMAMKTHTQANLKFIPVQVPFVKCYAFHVKIVWFGFLYAVVTPISVFIAFVGMVMTYFLERFLFNSKYSIPIYSGPRINHEMIGLLDWTPFIVGLFNLLLYKQSSFERNFESDHRVLGLIIAMIVVGCIHILMPWKIILKKFLKTTEQPDEVYNPNNMEITYQESEPFYRDSPFVIYREPKQTDYIRYSQIQKRKKNAAPEIPASIPPSAPSAGQLIKPPEENIVHTPFQQR